MIPAEAIAEVRDRHDLVAFIENEVGITLRRSGTGFLGLCPFHDDHQPSLSVDPRKQLWACLGACSAGGKRTGGDVIAFAQRFWGLGFPETLRKLGGSTVIEPPAPAAKAARPPLRLVASRNGGRKKRSGGGDGSRPPTAPDLLAQTAAYYHSTLLASPAAKDYLVARGITRGDVVSALGVGFADGSLTERAPEGSATFENLVSLGLLSRDGHELFSSCVVVPLRDLSGRIVNLYGRSIEGRRHLYMPGPRSGLVNATCAATTDELIVTESVIDALSFLEAGIPNAVPIYGTNGWTPDHDDLIAKHRIRRVVLALDPDAAGTKASAAIAGKLRGQGLEIVEVRVPAADPNALLVAEGAEGFGKTWRRVVAEAEAEAKATAASTTRTVAPTPPPRSLVAPLPGMTEGERAAKGEEGEGTGTSLTLATSPTPAPPALLQEDGAYVLHQNGRTYRVRGLSAHGMNRMRVNVRLDVKGRFHVDTFDIYSARSRKAFAEGAAETLRLSERTAGEVAQELTELIEALEAERVVLLSGSTEREAPAMTPAKREESLAFLRAPDLIIRICRDLRELGGVGEEDALLTGYLAMVSRKLPRPLAILFCARSGAGKSTMQELVTSLVPPEDVVAYSRVSGKVLYFVGENDLVHRVLAIEETDGATEAAYAIRSLQSNGYLTASVTVTDPMTGKHRAQSYRVNGPAAITMTTAHPEALDYETRNRFAILTADESIEQTRRILERQRWSETLEGLVDRKNRDVLLERHHDLQRLLETIEIVIPESLPSSFPEGRLILRREHRKYQALIKSITLLHQHQRPRRTVTTAAGPVAYIEATPGDVGLAARLTEAMLARSLDDLAPPSRTLLTDIRRHVIGRMKAEGVENPEEIVVTRREIQKVTGLSVWHLRTYLQQLVEHEYLVPVTGKKGQRYAYRLSLEAEAEEPDGGLQ